MLITDWLIQQFLPKNELGNSLRELHSWKWTTILLRHINDDAWRCWIKFEILPAIIRIAPTVVFTIGVSEYFS